ncbi:replication initiation protein [Acinetobacter baumannii]|uniref:replication initiation protein n=2 Tax=Gammaproteobacteria TaxID=1236 RepID=UPI0031D61CB7
MPENNVKTVNKHHQVYTPDNRYEPELSVMQNRMIEAWNSMSIDEKRIFVLASPLVRLCNATEQTRFSISAKDYAEACGIEIASAYSQLKTAADSLRGRYFSYINTAKKRVSVHWVIRIEYSEAEISFYFPDEVLYMLSIFDAQNPYTKFRIETALSLKGAHSLQLYQLLKQYETVGFREFSEELFRQTFELTKKYKVISNLRIRVIEPSVAEINAKTELKVKFSQLKKGNKVIGFRFDMKKPKSKKGSTGGASGNNNKLTAGQVFGLIVKNKLDDEVKIFGESMDDLNIRITSDFKNGREEKWLNFVREKSLI